MINCGLIQIFDFSMNCELSTFLTNTLKYLHIVSTHLKCTSPSGEKINHIQKYPLHADFISSSSMVRPLFSLQFGGRSSSNITEGLENNGLGQDICVKDLKSLIP